MAKELLNSSERFLLERWEESCQLEDALEGVREKYTATCQRAVDAIVEAHRAFDVSRVVVTQRWSSGYIGIGKSNWPAKDAYDFTGIYVDNIRLEVLADEGARAPSVYLYLAEKSSQRSKIDFAAIKTRVHQVAKVGLLPEVYDVAIGASDDDSFLCLPISSKAELLKQFASGDGSQFVETIVKGIEQLYPFAKTLDEFFPPNVGPK